MVIDCFVFWVWVNTYRYIFSGMNIHLPAILGFTRYQGFDPSPFDGPWPCFTCCQSRLYKSSQQFSCRTLHLFWLSIPVWCFLRLSKQSSTAIVCNHALQNTPNTGNSGKYVFAQCHINIYSIVIYNWSIFLLIQTTNWDVDANWDVNPVVSNGAYQGPTWHRSAESHMACAVSWSESVGFSMIATSTLPPSYINVCTLW